MNITEAQHVQRIAAFIAGDVDHEDEATREDIARDLAWLQHRAHRALGAGESKPYPVWDERLCSVTFEGGA